MSSPPDRYAEFPPGFFDRRDPGDDRKFYRQPRLVTHIDDVAIGAVGQTYATLGIGGRVLDVCGSWISHFATEPDPLIVHGMNTTELAANQAAAGGVVADLNRSPALPFADRSFDGATCCVSVDYLTRPLEVFDEVARVLRPGAIWCHVFSNRCFSTKAIRGWASTDDEGHKAIVAAYFARSAGWSEPQGLTVLEPGQGHDPLYAVWAARNPV